jgi:hypothetical protein
MHSLAIALGSDAMCGPSSRYDVGASCIGVTSQNMVLLDRLMHTYSGIQEIIRILWDRVVQSASCLCPGPGESS